MAKTASSVVKIIANVTYTNTTADGTAYVGTPSISNTYTQNSAAVSKVYNTEATISTATTLNFTSLTDAFGAVLDFAKVQGLYIMNNSANQTLVVGGTDQFIGSDQYTIQPGVAFVQNGTFTVTPSTANQLTLTPSGSLSYQLICVGI